MNCWFDRLTQVYKIHSSLLVFLSFFNFFFQFHSSIFFSLTMRFLNHFENNMGCLGFFFFVLLNLAFSKDFFKLN